MCINSILILKKWLLLYILPVSRIICITNAMHILSQHVCCIKLRLLQVMLSSIWLYILMCYELVIKFFLKKHLQLTMILNLEDKCQQRICGSSALRACSFKCVMNPVDVAAVANSFLSLLLVLPLWRMLAFFPDVFFGNF